MNIALIGYGKMGKTIDELATRQGHRIVARIDRQSGNHVLPEKCDVAIEFTNPESAPGNISACIDQNIPVVTGSTGWYKKLPEIIQLTEQKNGALLYSSNFSIGVNLFMEVNRVLAQLMNTQRQYDVSVSETHHTEKLDSPSGTAITLAEEIVRNLERKHDWTDQLKKEDGKLFITAHRESGVPGTHKILYHSVVDEIELIHRAKNRSGFANGAISAAEWLRGKKGVFTMKDVLNLNQNK